MNTLGVVAAHPDLEQLVLLQSGFAHLSTLGDRRRLVRLLIYFRLSRYRTCLLRPVTHVEAPVYA